MVTGLVRGCRDRALALIPRCTEAMPVSGLSTSQAFWTSKRFVESEQHELVRVLSALARSWPFCLTLTIGS